MNIIYLNAIIRDKESRTKRIADPIIKELKKKNNVEEINLNELDLTPYNQELFAKKSVEGTEAPFYELSKKIASSDALIIATPFWDMSFPAMLKSFLEKISLFEVMFIDDGKTCVGISKIKFMFLITTRGMNIPDRSKLEQGTPYLKALCELWGIKDFGYVSEYNLDYLPMEEIDKKIKHAIRVGKLRLSKFMSR